MTSSPRFFGPDEVAASLPWASLIESIEQILADPSASAPERTVHAIPVSGSDDAALLLKPGWVVGEVIVIKAVTFFPDNGERDLPTVNAGVLLFSGADGTFMGACDGNELTTRRTASASAVAAKRLARDDAKRLLVIGTGALSPMTAQAHCAVRDYESVEIWGRDPDKARRVANFLVTKNIPATQVDDLDTAVSEADTITSVTGATASLIKGALLTPGTHVDLIGAFTPQMRESDDDVIRRATIFLDTRADGAIAGDIAQPLQAGIITLENIAADLKELVNAQHPGRSSSEEITLFKSAGFALEDVAATRLVFSAEA